MLLIKYIIPLGFLCCLFFKIVYLVDLNCDYEDIGYTQIGVIYCCEVQNKLNISSVQSSIITSAIGNHTSGKSNDDVKGFIAYSKNVQYFPRNLQHIFKNLRKISITNGRLKEIHQEDLKLFSKLVNLHLEANDIEILEEGLFAYKTDLIYISLRDNKLIHIGQNVFEVLTKLKYLDLKYNPCISMDGIDNSTYVKIIINTARTNCSLPEFASIEAESTNLAIEYEYVNSRNLSDFNLQLLRFNQRYHNSRLFNASFVQRKIHKFYNIEYQMEILNRDTRNNIERIKYEGNVKSLVMLIVGLIQIIILVVGCMCFA